jgi:hypothetical protein
MIPNTRKRWLPIGAMMQIAFHCHRFARNVLSAGGGRNPPDRERGRAGPRRHMSSEAAYLNDEKFRPAIARLLWNCDDLRRYLANNDDSLIDYGARYRSKLPIWTSRADGCVDEIANTRMAKKQRMRWSPKGAHCVATVRAALLGGRLKPATGLQLAA